jgi:hypothetical protein
MKKYICGGCEKNFKKKSHLDYHILNKACKDVNYNCKFCEKGFTTDTSMYRHMKHTCKVKKVKDKENKEETNKIANMQSRMDEMEDLITRLTKKTEELESTNIGKTIMNGNITNVKGNITNVKGNMKIVNNIILVGYGKEDISKINKNKIVTGVKDGFYSTLSLTDAIHFNPEYPEYHNVYISSMKNKYAMMYDGTNWTLVMKDYLIDKLYMDKRNYIEENLDDFLDSLTTSQTNALDRWMDTDDDHDKIKEIKNKIKLLLYNKRYIAMNNSGRAYQIEDSDEHENEHTINISDDYNSDHPNNTKQKLVKVDKFKTMKDKAGPKTGSKRKTVAKAVKINKN